MSLRLLLGHGSRAARRSPWTLPRTLGRTKDVTLCSSRLNWRTKGFQSLAKDTNTGTKERPQPPKSQGGLVEQKAELGGANLSVKEQRQKDWKIIKNLMVNIWPAGDWGVKGRVVLGLGLLVGAKVSETGPSLEALTY
jgi:hypothetical protein